MQRAASRWVVVALVGVGLTATGANRAFSVPVSCAEVLATSNRLTIEWPEKSRDSVFIGRQLDVKPLLVRRCLESYGRRVKSLSSEDERPLEDILEAWESQEPVEIGPEERGAEVSRKEERRRRNPGPRLPPKQRKAVEFPHGEPKGVQRDF